MAMPNRRPNVDPVKVRPSAVRVFAIRGSATSGAARPHGLLGHVAMRGDVALPRLGGVGIGGLRQSVELAQQQFDDGSAKGPEARFTLANPQALDMRGQTSCTAPSMTFMRMSPAVGAACLLMVLTACGGRSESDLAEGAKQAGLIDPRADSLCAGRIFTRSGISDETLEHLDEAFDGSSKRPSVVVPQADNDRFAQAIDEIATECVRR